MTMKPMYDDAEPSSREPEVTAMVHHLAKAIAFQDEAINRLANRLQPVISPRPPRPDEAKPPQKVGCALAVEIGQLADHVYDNAQRLMSLGDAVEL